MKKHLKWLIPVLVLVAGYLFFTRPMTLEQLCPQFPWAQVTHVSGLEHLNDITAPAPTISSAAVSLDDSEARAIYDRCLTAKFRRDPITMLVNGFRGYSASFSIDDNAPELIFHAPDQMVVLMLYTTGDVTLSNASLEISFRCSDDALAQDLLTFLRAHRNS